MPLIGELGIITKELYEMIQTNRHRYSARWAYLSFCLLSFQPHFCLMTKLTDGHGMTTKHLHITLHIIQDGFRDNELVSKIHH